MKQSRNFFPRSRSVFDRIEGDVARFWDLSAGQPSPTGFPLNSARATVVAGSGFQQFFMVERDFGPVGAALARQFGDETVSAVVVRPSPETLRAELGAYPGFCLPSVGIETSWGEAVREPFSGEEIDALVYQADTMAAVGSSGAWGAWSDRSWSIGWIAASRPERVDLSGTDVDFYSVPETFEYFARPPNSLTREELQRTVHREFADMPTLHRP